MCSIGAKYIHGTFTGRNICVCVCENLFLKKKLLGADFYYMLMVGQNEAA